MREQQHLLWRWGFLCQNGERQSRGCDKKAAPQKAAPQAQPHLLLAMPVTLHKVVSFYTDLGPCHSPKSKSPKLSV